MEPFYYRKKSGQVPVKHYLSQFYPNLKDNENLKKQKRSSLTKIDSIIRMAASRGGVIGRELSAPVPGHKYKKLRISVSDRLIRILYSGFSRSERLVLFNAYEKPKYYAGNTVNKVNSIRDRTLEETDIFYEDFIQNQDQYEKYE